MFEQPAILPRRRRLALGLGMLGEEALREVRHGRSGLQLGGGWISTRGNEPEQPSRLGPCRLGCPGRAVATDCVPASPPVNVVLQQISDRLALLSASMEPWYGTVPSSHLLEPGCIVLTSRNVINVLHEPAQTPARHRQSGRDGDG
jgi:hypothetical protein